jgi:hypothetical protein
MSAVKWDKPIYGLHNAAGASAPKGRKPFFANITNYLFWFQS